MSRKIVSEFTMCTQRYTKRLNSHVDLDQRCDITTGSHRTGGSEPSRETRHHSRNTPTPRTVPVMGVKSKIKELRRLYVCSCSLYTGLYTVLVLVYSRDCTS